MKNYFKNFFTDCRKVKDPRYNCIMTNGFDNAFGPFARLVELFIATSILLCGGAWIYTILLRW